MTHSDPRGLVLTTESGVAAQAFNDAVANFIDWRTATMQHLKTALEADPEFSLAHAVRGILTFGLRQPALYGSVAKSLEAAKLTAHAATPRERAYVEALQDMLAGDLAAAVARFESIIQDNPLDLLAIRLAQLELFWLGEARWTRDIGERAAPAWSADIPGYSAFLSVRAFNLEEVGEYTEAERCGREAIDMDPADCWGAHAVAHVLEMQGRHDEGISLLDDLKENWAGANHIVHHLWWHRALFQVERGDYAGGLEIYDAYIRDPDSPLIQAVPDFYLDIQNTAALLLRLELRGIDVGARWQVVADLGAERIGNHTSPFTSAHCAVALAAAGRDEEVVALLGGMAAFAANDSGTLGTRYRVAAIPASCAAAAHRKGDHKAVIDLLMPARRSLWQMGGSHAQRDLFFQILADSARQLNRADILKILMDDVRRIGFTAIEDRTSYADIAQ
jgi:tetratricopeptide (TPR) repeat protein